jgi:putative ABC transport system permease protein
MGPLWAAGTLLRRLRTEAGLVVLLVLLVAATSFVFAVAPRLFNRVADDAIRHTLAGAAPAQRDLSVGLAGTLDPGPDGVSGVRAYAGEVVGKFPPSLQRVISKETLRVTATRFFVRNTAIGGIHFSLRYQDGLTDETRLVAGHWPRVGKPWPRAVNPGSGEQPGGKHPHPVTLEVAMSTIQVQALGLKLGDRLPAFVDGSDPLISGIATGTIGGSAARYQIVPTSFEVVGLYEPIDPNADYWAGDASLLQIQLATLAQPEQYVAAYFPAESYPSLFSAGMPFRYEWHFVVDPQRVDAGQLDQLRNDVRGLNIFTGTSEFASPGVPILRTGLVGVLDAFAAERSRSEGVLSMAAIGPFVVAAGAVGVMAILLVLRRRSSLVIARGRGASAWLVLGTELWEAVLLAGAASLIGLLAAVTLVPARASPASALLAFGVALTAVGLLLGATWPLVRGNLGQGARDDAPVLRVPPRRLVIELTIVLIAVGGVFLLRQRGLGSAAPGSTSGGDLLLLGVPVLSGLAAGIVAMRFFPVPVRLLGWLAARRRDLVPVLGLRSVGRNGAAANLFLVVLLLTAAFVAFASVIVASLEQGQLVASYQAVGADYRIEQTATGSLAAVDAMSIPGVEAAAFGHVERGADFMSVPTQRAVIYLDAVDPAAYAAVAAGTPADPHWPSAFLAKPPSGEYGTPEHPVPAILSWNLPNGSANLATGDTFQMIVARDEVTFKVVARWGQVPGIGSPASFVVAPYTWLEHVNPDTTLYPSILWVRGPASAAALLAAEVQKQVAGTSRTTVRYDVLNGLRDTPFGNAVASGFGLAVLVAEIYLALTVIGALVLSSARRTRDLAYLRTLGVTGGQAIGLTVMEHAPAVLLAILPGIALGIGVGLLLEPSLGLGTFIGSSDVPPFVDWAALGVLTAVLIGVVAVAIIAGTWLSGRARMMNALRVGED